MEGFPRTNVHNGVVETLLDGANVGLPVAGVREANQGGVSPIRGHRLTHFVNETSNGRDGNGLSFKVREARDPSLGCCDHRSQLTLIERCNGDERHASGARLQNVSQAQGGDIVFAAREHRGRPSPVVTVRDEFDVESGPRKAPVAPGQEEAGMVGPRVYVFEHYSCDWHGVPSCSVRASVLVRASSTRAHRAWNRSSRRVPRPRGCGRSIGMTSVM